MGSKMSHLVSHQKIARFNLLRSNQVYMFGSKFEGTLISCETSFAKSLKIFTCVHNFEYVCKLGAAFRNLIKILIYFLAE